MTIPTTTNAGITPEDSKNAMKASLYFLFNANARWIDDETVGIKKKIAILPQEQQRTMDRTLALLNLHHVMQDGGDINYIISDISEDVSPEQYWELMSSAEYIGAAVKNAFGLAAVRDALPPESRTPSVGRTFESVNCTTLAAACTP